MTEETDELLSGSVEGVVDDGSDEVLSTLDCSELASDDVLELFVELTAEEVEVIELLLVVVDDTDELLTVGGNGTTRSGESPKKSFWVWSSLLSGVEISEDEVSVDVSCDDVSLSEETPVTGEEGKIRTLTNLATI